MLKKIRGFYNLTEDIETLTIGFKTFQQLMEQISRQFKTELEELKDIKNYQMGYLETYKRNLGDIEKLKKILEREVQDFQSLKLQTQKTILDKFERQLRMNFLKYNEELKIDKENYEKIKEKVDATIQNIFMLNGEIGKFMDVSRKIKTADYDLTKFHTQIIREDKNKLELMHRIDQLERMLAKMKRGESRR